MTRRGILLGGARLFAGSPDILSDMVFLECRGQWPPRLT